MQKLSFLNVIKIPPKFRSSHFHVSCVCGRLCYGSTPDMKSPDKICINQLLVNRLKGLLSRKEKSALIVMIGFALVHEAVHFLVRFDHAQESPIELDYRLACDTNAISGMEN